MSESAAESAQAPAIDVRVVADRTSLEHAIDALSRAEVVALAHDTELDGRTGARLDAYLIEGSRRTPRVGLHSFMLMAGRA